MKIEVKKHDYMYLYNDGAQTVAGMNMHGESIQELEDKLHADWKKKASDLEANQNFIAGLPDISLMSVFEFRDGAVSLVVKDGKWTSCGRSFDTREELLNYIAEAMGETEHAISIAEANWKDFKETVDKAIAPFREAIDKGVANHIDW